jgi:pilus assembly protein CpaC
VNVRSVSTEANDRLDAVRRELRAELPGQTLKLSAANSNIFLRGTVKNLESAKRAVQIASTAGKVINLLDVQVPSSDPQILLKVRFASIDRSRLRELGINIFNLGAYNLVGGVSTGQFSPPFISGSSGTSSSGFSSQGAQATFGNELNLLGFYSPSGIGVDIKALETTGVVQVLAQPNIVAQNGKEASFLAGGEFPYPVVQSTGTGSGAVTIMFKEFGVRLNFIPTITPRGSIRLQVAPEVSTLDYSHAVQVSGFNVPAIATRKVNTQVELNDRQSFVIGGLLDQEEQKTFEKIPFLGDIPILGKFFQSQSLNKTDSELILIVTPEIVEPIAAGQSLPELKTSESHLTANSNIPVNQPDAKTAENTQTPAPTVIHIETLEESLKPEQPLVIETGTGVSGAASTSLGGSSTSTTTGSK